MNNELHEAFEGYQQRYPATARLEYYLKMAKARKATATNDEVNTIRYLQADVETALKGITSRDIDLFAQAFEHVIRLTVKLKLPEYEKVMERINQSKRANVRAKSYAKLKSRAIELYENGNWNNPRAASIALVHELGPRPPKQRTIYNWLLKHIKNKT